MSGMAGRKSGRRLGRLATLASMLMAPLPAIAADPAAPRSGFYVGGHVGYMFGSANATLGDPTSSVQGASPRQAESPATAPSSAACRRATSISLRRG